MKNKEFVRPRFEFFRDQFNYFCAEKYHSIGVYSHFHKNSELYCVHSGEVSVLIDNNRYRLKAGEAAFINPMNIHSYICEGEGADVTYVIFGERYMKPFYDLYPDTELPTELLNKERNRELFSYLDTVSRKIEDFTPIECLACTYRILDFIVSNYGLLPKRSKPIKQRADITDIVNYITQNCEKDLSLATLAEHFHYEPLSLSHLFSRNIRIDIRNFINDVRIQKFLHLKSLPENQNKSITELAGMCGFNSSATFYRAYNKYVRNAGVEFPMSKKI